MIGAIYAEPKYGEERGYCVGDKESLRSGLLRGVSEREVANVEVLSEGLGLFSSKLQKKKTCCAKDVTAIS